MGRQSRRMREALAQMEAEDRVLAYLARQPREVRAAVAANAAQQLLYRWEVLWDELIEQGDRRKVFIATPRQFESLHAELAGIIAERSPSDPVAEKHVIGLFEGLFADDAAWVAIRIAREAYHSYGYWRGESANMSDCK